MDYINRYTKLQTSQLIVRHTTYRQTSRNSRDIPGDSPRCDHQAAAAHLLAGHLPEAAVLVQLADQQHHQVQRHARHHAAELQQSAHGRPGVPLVTAEAA